MSTIISDAERQALLEEARRLVEKTRCLTTDINEIDFDDEDAPGTHHGHSRRPLITLGLGSDYSVSYPTAEIIRFPVERVRRVRLHR